MREKSLCAESTGIFRRNVCTKKKLYCVVRIHMIEVLSESGFEALPDSIKDELKIMCVLYTEDVGGILTLVFEEDGELMFEVTTEDNDLLFDEIGSHLKIKELQRTKKELLESLQLYYRVFFLGEEV